jgi:hypothetical protein
MTDLRPGPAVHPGYTQRPDMTRRVIMSEFEYVMVLVSIVVAVASQFLFTTQELGVLGSW